jgi:hypothetical protein
MTSITWTPVSDALPDDEETVLLAMDDGEVWTGFHEGDEWRYVSADPIAPGSVTHWAPFPEPPAA